MLEAQSNIFTIDVSAIPLADLPAVIGSLVGWGTGIGTLKQQYDDISSSISNGTPILYTDGKGCCPASWEKTYNPDGPEFVSYLALRQDAPSMAEYDGSIKLYIGSIDKDGNKQEKRNIIKFDLPNTGEWGPQIVFTNQGGGTKALMDDAQYHEVVKEAPGDGKTYGRKDKNWVEVGGGYQLPAATPAALGGVKTGYTQSNKNYPVQLDTDSMAYVNVPWTDTTYPLVTASANGLMQSTDKAKMDILRSYTTATTVSNLNANYETIYVTLNANAALSVNATGHTYNGRTITAYVYCSSARTITIPTSGVYRSMCGSSYTCPAGKYVEFNLTCVNGIWHIAKLEQQ